MYSPLSKSSCEDCEDSTRRSKRSREEAVGADEYSINDEDDNNVDNDVFVKSQDRVDEDESLPQKVPTTLVEVEELKNKRITLKKNVKDPLPEILVHASKIHQGQAQSEDAQAGSDEEFYSADDEETNSQPSQLETQPRITQSTPPTKKQKANKNMDGDRLTPPMYRLENKSRSLNFSESPESQVESGNDFLDTPPQEKKSNPKRIKYNEEEKDAIKAGQAKFGNRWARIRAEYPILNGRSTVSIKVCSFFVFFAGLLLSTDFSSYTYSIYLYLLPSLF